MNIRQKASIWSDVDFALGMLDSAKSLLNRDLGLSSGYIEGAERDIKQIEKKLNRF